MGMGQKVGIKKILRRPWNFTIVVSVNWELQNCTIVSNNYYCWFSEPGNCTFLQLLTIVDAVN